MHRPHSPGQNVIVRERLLEDDPHPQRGHALVGNAKARGQILQDVQDAAAPRARIRAMASA